MTPISDALKDLLGRQGLTAREGLAGPVARGMKERGAASDGARSQVMADAAGGTPHRPTAGGGPADENSGKDRGNVTPAKFTGLHIVVDNSRCKPIHTPTRVAPRGIGFHLVLIEGGRK